jgi:heparin/heparan-sulfate lyase
MRLVFCAAVCLVAGIAAGRAAGQGPAVPTPPPEHPRLYLRAGDLPLLRQRLNHPRMSPVWAKAQSGAAARPDNLKPEELTRLIALKALVHLLQDDDARGREAIALLRDYLPAASFDLKAQDISRQIGALMLSSAMVYDWCYPQLTSEDRTLFITHIERLARMLETGYPPTRGGAVTGHAGEAMLMRDMLGAGIAIYDEKPEMYQLVSRRIFGEHIPARNFFYPSASHHQGSAYGPYRYSWEILCASILKRMTGQDYFIREQSQVPYRWVYSRRPDGLLLANGDVFRSGSTTWADLLTASYYGDAFLQNQVVNAKDFSRLPLVEQILFWDPALEPKPAQLPLARFFGFPLSAIVARTGWDQNGAVVEMKMQDYQFNNHQHLDAGSFQIFYHGALAVDSGLYSTYGSDHDGNYLKRTIAHNAMLVFDPDEQFRKGQWVNDGGQRWPANGSEPINLDALLRNGYRVSTVTKRQITDDISMLEGDLTNAYSTKVVSYRRGFVFINLHDAKRPGALVVYDDITSAKPEFVKTWLLHSLNEPEVKGGTTVIGQNGGKLVNQTLEPAAFHITKVGGPGHEFEVAGANHPPNRAPRADDEAGSWRIELSPDRPSATDHFVNVMQIMDEDVDPLPVTRTKSGVRIGDRVVTF